MGNKKAVVQRYTPVPHTLLKTQQAFPRYWYLNSLKRLTWYLAETVMYQEYTNAINLFRSHERSVRRLHWDQKGVWI